MKKFSILIALFCVFYTTKAYSDERMDKFYNAAVDISNGYAQCAALYAILAELNEGAKSTDSMVIALGHMMLAKKFGEAGQKNGADVEDTVKLYAVIIGMTTKDEEFRKAYIDIETKNCAEMLSNQEKLIATKMRENDVPEDIIKSMGYE